MVDDLTNNKIQFDKFKDDVGDSLETMSKSVNQKYRLTQEYQEKVLQRMSKFEDKVYKPADVKERYQSSGIKEGDPGLKSSGTVFTEGTQSVANNAEIHDSASFQKQDLSNRNQLA